MAPFWGNVRMPRPLRVLMIEDSDFDAELLLALLNRGGYQVTYARVETAEALRKALQESWEIVIADYNLPQFDALSALDRLRSQAGISDRQSGRRDRAGIIVSSRGR